MCFLEAWMAFFRALLSLDEWSKLLKIAPPSFDIFLDGCLLVCLRFNGGIFFNDVIVVSWNTGRLSSWWMMLPMRIPATLLPMATWGAFNKCYPHTIINRFFNQVQARLVLTHQSNILYFSSFAAFYAMLTKTWLFHFDYSIKPWTWVTMIYYETIWTLRIPVLTWFFVSDRCFCHDSELRDFPAATPCFCPHNRNEKEEEGFKQTMCW